MFPAEKYLNRVQSSYWSPRITFTLWWSSPWFLEDVLQSDNCISDTISVETIKCSTHRNTVVFWNSNRAAALFQVYWRKHYFRLVLTGIAEQ